MMSSVSADLPYPGISLYSGTKAFIRLFSLSISHEIREKVDMLIVKPAVVSTAMARYLKVSKYIASPEEVIQDSLAVLGHQLETQGSRKHVALVEKWKKLPFQKVIEMNAKGTDIFKN